jgi:tetratricopeptide (TPR) repeat protein
VAAQKAQSLEVQGTEKGGFIGEGFDGPHVAEALDHLDKAIALTPDDITIHQGRLFMLLHSGRVSETPAALQKSLAVYTGPDALYQWLGYCAELADRNAYDVAVAYMRVLEKKYPNHPDVVSNIGAFLSMAKKYDEALPYAKRGAELAPNDPINVWNLGRAYDHVGKLDLAAPYYLKGIELERNPDSLRDKKCLYAEFLERRGDKAGAAQYRKGNCDS